ncbi:recombinase family protein [Agathobaculum sp. NTUH-O15-33]|uniref:recombinase family protein n=1 Tax=Agathobaculum sp. NTUH-O15-33 TaxID=3079302 RepID=UPI0029586909|nr:recombinase family protein [Agathobaculum sp. NTUH-O15-33]WNX85738.1 recombinase family protein [Agathobaculum sp. NTUH-O15-33]
MEKIYGYARVSTREQNLDRQILALRQYVKDDRDIITDKESGKNFDRPGYRSLRDTLLRAGDTLIVKSLDRLGRNKEQMKNEVQWFNTHDIRLKVIDLPTTMTDLPDDQKWIIEMANNIMIEVLSSIAEQERETIRQRQAEGIEAARQKGKHLGRNPAQYPERWAEVYSAWNAGGITATQAMKTLGLKRTTFYKLAKCMAKKD